MVLVGYNKEQHVFLINFNYMTLLLKRGVLVALNHNNHLCINAQKSKNTFALLFRT